MDRATYLVNLSDMLAVVVVNRCRKDQFSTCVDEAAGKKWEGQDSNLKKRRLRIMRKTLNVRVVRCTSVTLRDSHSH